MPDIAVPCPLFFGNTMPDHGRSIFGTSAGGSLPIHTDVSACAGRTGPGLRTVTAANLRTAVIVDGDRTAATGIHRFAMAKP